MSEELDAQLYGAPSPEQPEHEEARRLAVKARTTGIQPAGAEIRMRNELGQTILELLALLSKVEQTATQLKTEQDAAMKDAREWRAAAEDAHGKVFDERDRAEAAEREVERLWEACDALLPHLTHTHDYTSAAIECRACKFADALSADTQRED